jgi:tetratricopeptide (TPR) repeat protein
MFTERKILLLLLLSGLVLRICYLWQFSASPLFMVPIGPDVQEYDEWARSILAGNLIWQIVPIHAPLYPYFLAAIYYCVGYNFLLIRFFQLLIGLGGFYLLFLTIRRLSGSRHSVIAYITLAIAAIYTPLIYYQGELVCESLLLPLLCCNIFLLYLGEPRRNNNLPDNKYFWYCCCAGAAAGMTIITHPLSLLFITAELLLFIWIGYRRKNYRYSVIFAIAAAVIIAPVSIYNTVLAGKFVMVQENSGLNFYIGNNANATGGCYVRPGPGWDSLTLKVDAGSVNDGNSFVSLALQDICSNPVRWCGLLFKKALYVWNWRDLTAGADAEPLREYSEIMRFSWWMPGVIFSLGFAGMILMLSSWRKCYQYRHFILLLAAFWLAQTITVTSGRYRLAMLPAIFVFAAFFIQYFQLYWNKRRHLLIFACVTAVLLVFLPQAPCDIVQDQAESDSLLGEAYFRSGNLTVAQWHLQAALPALQDKARCLNMLGIIAEKQSNQSDAVKLFKASIDANPASPEGYMNLAVAASAKNEFKDADYFFNEALLRAKNNPDVFYNYAYYLERRGQINAAEQYYHLCLKRNPGHSRSLNGLGVIAMNKRDYTAAALRFKQALAVAPEVTGFMLNLAAATAAGGDNEKAEEIVNLILSKEPAHSNALLMKKMLVTPKKPSQ